MGISVTDVDTEAKLPLGFVYREPAAGDDLGEKHWVYVFNDETSASFVQGTIVARDAATSTTDAIIAPVDTNPMRVLGVAQHTIAAGSYGFVLSKGIGEVLAGTETIDASEVVAVSATDAGKGMEGGSIAADAHEACVIGYSTESVDAAALATCYINCLGA
tara:strand:+ start:38 stop:520 length:483 start_codon:yes stop_codon:yes gene_type:complete